MPKEYVVRPTPDEPQQLIALTSTGKASARTTKHANVTLLADASAREHTDQQIAASLHVAVRTIERLRMWFVTEGLERALHRKPQDKPSREPILDGRAEWTLHLLAEKMVELKVVKSISHDIVRRALIKTT